VKLAFNLVHGSVASRLCVRTRQLIVPPSGLCDQGLLLGRAWCCGGTPVGNASRVDTSSDRLFGANQTDVEVGIADPASSCAEWIQGLAGDGLVWYPLTHMVLPGNAGSADQGTMEERAT
jgi:hypothetical protein